jgi:iron complex outermembrane receptor protein
LGQRNPQIAQENVGTGVTEKGRSVMGLGAKSFQAKKKGLSMKLQFKQQLQLGAGSLAIALAVGATPAFAQESADAADDMIIVTGSRIASATVESAAPLQLVDEGAIDDAGVTNVQELLLENPVFGTPALSRTNSAFLTSGTGTATVDLRDLGSDRTLVLINGRRVVSSLAGSATVDLNVIPTQFVERIDILTGGASSLYGSDAIAGVVNFVYKQDFEGLEATAQAGITEEGDDERFQLNLTGGTSFDDGRGHIMVHMGYSKENGVLSRERSNTVLDDIDTAAGVSGDPADFGIPFEPAFSGFAPQGSFTSGQRFNASGQPIGSLYTFTYSPAGALQPCFNSNALTCTSGRAAIADNPNTPNVNEASPAVPSLGTGVGPNGFNRQFSRTIAVPVERYLLAVTGEYELFDNVNLFWEGTYNRTSSSREIEPFALSSDGSTGVYPSGSRMPVENYVLGNWDNNAATPPTMQLVTNPLVPAAILAVSNDTNGDGLRDIGFSRRITEFGSRLGSTDRDFMRFVAGLNGTLFDNQFRWDVSYNYGSVSENQISTGQVNVVNFANALAVMPDVFNVDPLRDTICIDADARAAGCVPANIFGEGNISQAAVDYIQAQGTYQTDITQQVIQGNISGTLFELPAGPLGVALGVEYRKEASRSDNDALTNQGLNAGNKLPDTEGQFQVYEAFGEVRIPILADTPFFDLLEVGGAARVADYSTVGTVWSYNVTGTWAPVPDVRFRGSYARSVRAPNVGELFAGLSQTFPTGLVDPCLGITATSTGATADNCRAAPGVNANIAANGAFAATQSDRQGVSGFNGGNPNLEEETATSWTVGAVIQPRSIDALSGFTATVDYYNIEVKNVIAAFGRQFILDQCYNQSNALFCPLIIRRPAATSNNSAGSLEFINALAVNSAVLETDGIDATLAYTSGLGLMADDRLTANVAYTHVFKGDYTPLEGQPTDPYAGEIGTSKDRFTANLGYGTDLFRISFTGTYIGSATEDDQFCSAFDLDAGCFRQGAEFYLDTQVSVNASEYLNVYLGVDNLLDNKAPNLLSGTTFNVTGTDTAADVYDVFGRRAYIGARLKF